LLLRTHIFADRPETLQAQAEKDEERLLHFAEQLKLAEEALEVANYKIETLEKGRGLSTTSTSGLFSHSVARPFCSFLLFFLP
jgi:hypothetical protein